MSSFLNMTKKRINIINQQKKKVTLIALSKGCALPPKTKIVPVGTELTKSLGMRSRLTDIFNTLR